MSGLRRGLQVSRLVAAFRRERRAEVRFSRLMAGVYLGLGLLLLVCGGWLVGIAVGLLSPGTGTTDGAAVYGTVSLGVGLVLFGMGCGQVRRGTPALVVDDEGVHVLGKVVPWAHVSGFRTQQHRTGHSSHTVATIVVDEASARAWSQARREPERRGSRLYALGTVGPDGIALPFNLAVDPAPLCEALEAIRLEVRGRQTGAVDPAPDEVSSEQPPHA
ncbi:hypothetical protein [Terrabacter terrigena]|uniref:PH domain-containing protein n=1 Tax=Terrabacter terrigena TaxID=574718 RepID=A0ABW3N2V4_9MICO